jgi:hypothetical protein
MIVKEGNGNVFLWVTDICHIQKIRCSVHAEVLMVKLKTLHLEFSFTDQLQCRACYYTLHYLTCYASKIYRLQFHVT